MSVAKLEGQRALIHVQNDDHQQGTHNGAAPTAVRVTIRVEQPATLAAVVSVGSCVHLACSEAHAPRAPGLGVAKRRVRIAEAHEDIAVAVHDARWCRHRHGALPAANDGHAEGRSASCRLRILCFGSIARRQHDRVSIR